MLPKVLFQLSDGVSMKRDSGTHPGYLQGGDRVSIGMRRAGTEGEGEE